MTLRAKFSHQISISFSLIDPATTVLYRPINAYLGNW